ncbi:MAG: ribose-phosphate pyrophosphokinase [Armatimonadetes bacterium CG_4_10_14_3_um_filter_59_10]|nr:MAG: ribose-phosphate pyrophosphokinase [Armatimonadetes bacterium CG_4_10_14_3_um_filter_59_10]
MHNRDRLILFAGRSGQKLGQSIAQCLETELSQREFVQFSNENIKVRILENVREADVFIVQTSSPPLHENIVELLISIDAIKHASARRVTAVLPYFPYVRSDKKDEPRISITARLMADLIAAAGADRILTMNLHSPQIQGFFKIPGDQLDAAPILCDYLRRKDLSNTVIVAPDAGSAKRAGAYATRLDLPLAILDKRRSDDTESPEILHVIGEVEGRTCLIIDDEISTGGSLHETVEALRHLGAEKIYAACVHPVFCGKAVERINAAKLEEIIVTDTVPLSEKDDAVNNLQVLSVAPLFANAIRSINEGESVSALFR